MLTWNFSFLTQFPPVRGLLLSVVFAMAAGCGQKGALYLSDNPPPGVKPPASKAYKPVPYPKEEQEK